MAEADQAPAGCDGLVLLPYFEGERTPNVPDGTGVWFGVNKKTFEAGHFARASMEGVTLGMNYGLRRLTELGVKPTQIRATGGGAKSKIWRQIMADIFIGGFGDGGMLASSIVADYQKTYAKTHSGSVYFEWTSSKDIVKYLDKLPPDEPINLIGHSYGGDTAGVIAARYKRRINVLVTVDPVGSGQYMINAIKGNCTVWVDVNAQPSGWFNLSNIAAGVGQAWNKEPRGIANFYIEAPFNHEEFSNLMNSPDSDGHTAAMILAHYCTTTR